MGETYAEVLLKADGRQTKKRLLVDTGATYSWIRSKTLIALGISPTDAEEMETIEGKRVVRKIGQMRVECQGRETWTWVIFGKARDSEVLGLHALEGLRLEVDPFRRTLRKAKAIKAYSGEPKPAS